MKKSSYFMLLALSALAACAVTDTSLEVTSDTIVATKLRTVSAEQYLGSTTAIVRSFVETSDGKSQEVAGARCTLSSSDVRATVTTPARVKLPAYVQGERFANRGKPSDLRVSCRSSEGTGSVTIGALPTGSGSTQQKTNYIDSATGQTAYTSTTTTHYAGLSSSFPWGYGAKINVVLD